MQPPQGYGPSQMPAQHPQGPPHPYPPYGPPQPRFQKPPRKSNLGWILGAVAVVFFILLFAGCSTMVNGINAGGNHKEKVKTMIARADNVPESDWELVGRSDPKVESAYLSIDVACVRLNATWSVAHKVSLEGTASRLGMDMSGPPMGRYTGCIKSDLEDGSTANVCINPAPGQEDSWLVSVNLTAK